ncbi:Exoenzyme S synthesis regulatory protein ExsA [Marinobacterium sp. xm-a-121]|nr:Exoenzyme S synthesis regulatory protein ExsA [Marinobacterium sp. xm-g-48]NRP15755.1 Exoenzyme S synthesis regulatory protein ExsA [Marinobacterium sp. xm-a-152]NRP27571.1 Exoenzyme S synthesis regulatory protein ExsA [Marinobacterium sp. xm-d-420]NRP38848.1 Exoenzyme S synthesis regulatory protein ExsA [Marinobacterium sp. xm-a-121]NRP83027.1 Exoenzyme S synthesis regulatory protein ExsA [Marinobacterium sp. xm-d-509]NRP99664.1 Exoenzyme S synthesis regulatory protein ExsA [Marinobacteriu
MTPNYALYGDSQSDAQAGFVHIETVQESSRPYRGIIKPHKHSDLFQVLIIEQGEAEIQLEDDQVSINEPVIVTLPPDNRHGFHFHNGIRGVILSIALPIIQQDIDIVTSSASILLLGDKEEATKQILTIAELLIEEQQQPTDQQSVSLQLIHTLFAMIKRVDTALTLSEKLPDALKQFSQLIESSLENRWDIDDYASQCGVSTSTLNRLCKKHFGKSALQTINQRLAIEIKRRLAFTQRSIALISDELGFSDPGYFTRFVKRELGETPMAFRKRHQFDVESG